MNLQKLFAMQDILDQKIRKEHGLERADLFNDKILALYVEVAELANETRCFKYWSHKPSSPREVILEEYVDGFHFLLSLGLECGFADDIPNFFAIENGEKDVTGLFLEFIHGINQFKERRSSDTYWTLFTLFFNLGKKLGFTEEEIFQAYVEKNEVNHKRQDEGY